MKKLILYIVIHLIEKKRNGVGAYDIWSDMGIGSPHKVYLGSTIRGLGYNLKSEQGQVCLPVHPDYSQQHMDMQG